ncbi:MAG: CHAT domain-containing protein, partial [Acidobacteriota bacterium]
LKLLDWNLNELMATSDPPLPPDGLLDARGITRLADEVGPILAYYSSSELLIGFLVLPGRENPFVQVISYKRLELASLVDQARLALANPGQPGKPGLLRQLWDGLIGPFLEELPSHGPLTVIPHGPLHQLPFEVLTDASGKPMYERWLVTTAPSASILAVCRQRHSPRSDREPFWAMGDRNALRFKPETQDIARLFDSRNPSEFNLADFERFRTQVPNQRHLLIATQGRLDEDNRSNTYLEIQPTQQHDPRLTAAEISSMSIPAELVALAACDSNAAEPLQSDERLDLTRAFLIAGAASVLATRWKIQEDESTTRFLTDFYQAYRRGGPNRQGLRKDEALNVARRKSRERGDPAQVWAAWVLVGDPR